MIRPFRLEDRVKVEEIHSRVSEFPMIDYKKPTVIIKKTIEVDGKIVGSAFVHLTSEVGLILDDNLSNLAKAKIIKELFDKIYKEITATDLDDAHVFVTPESDTHYADFLIKNCGFKKDTGLVLYRGRDNE